MSLSFCFGLVGPRVVFCFLLLGVLAGVLGFSVFGRAHWWRAALSASCGGWGCVAKVQQLEAGLLFSPLDAAGGDGGAVEGGADSVLGRARYDWCPFLGAPGDPSFPGGPEKASGLGPICPESSAGEAPAPRRKAAKGRTLPP